MNRLLLASGAIYALAIGAASAEAPLTVEDCSANSINSDMAEKCKAFLENAVSVKENLQKLDNDPGKKLSEAAPDGGQEGAVSLGDKAGTGEFQLLSAAALNEAATTLGDVIHHKADSGSKRVILVGSDAKESSLQWDVFKLQIKDFRDRADAGSELSQEIGRMTDAGEELRSNYAIEIAIKGESALALASFAGGALKFASAITKFFKSDYEYIGFSENGNDEKLIAAVACRLIKLRPTTSAGNGYQIYAPGIASSLSSGIAVRTEIETADEAFKGFSDKLKNLKDKVSALETSKDKDKQDVAKYLKEANELLSKGDQLVANYSGYTDKIMTATGENPPLIISIIRDHAYGSALQGEAPEQNLIVRLKSFNEVGSGYTKKNLWTTFGAAPFYISGGAVLSYSMTNGSDGNLMAAGFIPVQSGFVKAGKVKNHISGSNNVCGMTSGELQKNEER